MTLYYAKPGELKDLTGITQSTHDVELEMWLEAAEAAIDGFCNRERGMFKALTTATSRYYVGSGKAKQSIDECVEVATVAVKDAALDTDYVTWTTPTTALAGDGDWIPAAGSLAHPNYNITPYTMLIIDPNGDYNYFTGGEYAGRKGFSHEANAIRNIPTVRVTARWGYAAAVPENVKTAVIAQAARWYKRGQSSMADAVTNPELGQMQYRKVLDPDIQMMLVSARLVNVQV